MIIKNVFTPWDTGTIHQISMKRAQGYSLRPPLFKQRLFLYPRSEGYNPFAGNNTPRQKHELVYKYTMEEHTLIYEFSWFLYASNTSPVFCINSTITSSDSIIVWSVVNLHEHDSLEQHEIHLQFQTVHHISTSSQLLSLKSMELENDTFQIDFSLVYWYLIFCMYMSGLGDAGHSSPCAPMMSMRKCNLEREKSMPDLIVRCVYCSICSSSACRTPEMI